MQDTNAQAPDPQAGGRYERNTDGSLTQIHKTEEEQVQRKDVAASPTTQATGAAPAAGGAQE
jgi:hypothetical protein